ncbi:hypothetical protein G6O69_22790 [Pseudenhygromyxa sp. WMMC2535]|uniref:S10 family serine carboxypeptidase-like protein n=1 Tax=Pseudenhygromyxa sp. WMMC2535 TaxID=2712867 RepID=UPI001555D4BB|nr:hypothetical protein [Pseudenhygromyxa sp. WMMC2535]NVB40684.1 hypothetical protein [Pseudenhygromyxa sp. WMMC2535]
MVSAATASAVLARARARVLGLGCALWLVACGGEPGADEALEPGQSSDDEFGSEDGQSGAESEGEGEGESESDGPIADLGQPDVGSPCPPAPCEACVCEAGELLCDCAGLGPEAGFVALEAVAYTLGEGEQAQALETTDARSFYSFWPAALGSDDRPLFVFFNGGPGVSSGMLLGLNVGPRTFDPAAVEPGLSHAANPASWTSLGNLLWIDARNTGFGYGLLDDPSEAAARGAAMSVGSFNAYADAGDFVRVLLRFLAAHPSLEDNPVVLVAESYGGTRAQIMLDMLLYPGAYADASRRMIDPALSAEIQAHHELVLGADEPGPQMIAAQFGRQVLIQPAMTGKTQKIAAGEYFEGPDSPLLALADDLGVVYQSCAELMEACSPYDHALDFASAHGRSPYDYRSPASWLNDLFALVNLRLNDAETAQAMFGVTAEEIVGLDAGARAQAWRAISAAAFPADADIGSWPASLGELESWDRYFVPFHHEVLSRFNGAAAKNMGVNPDDEHFGELFLSNLRWVDTMITVTDYDLVVHTPAMPLALAAYVELVSSVDVDELQSRWIVEYAAAAFPDDPPVGSREVAAPRFEASHAVSLDAPAQLRDAVEAWL